MTRLGKIETSQIKIQVYEKCKSMIVSGAWAPGDRLPSESQLCAQLGVSRVSVRAALQSLEAQGFIEIRRGEGSYVKHFNLSDQLELLLPIFALGKKDILDVLKFRLITEPSFMPYVIDNASQDDIDALELILKKMKTNTSNMRKHAQLDEQFHFKLTEIVNNSVVYKVYRILFEIFNSTWNEVCSILGPDAGIHYHARLLEAIKNRDKQNATDIMREHVQWTFDQIKEFYDNQEIAEIQPVAID
ncbi:FadR/GntR family transcriptional regulator [Marispirochaeta sp.]|jgi:GntR family transcriptional regulator, transcriptional repressor for pyruvate dehydrogenase complex|uniref:FadR/GntR family transcriptional regulator n=1 Tax=Marispirochaeta sp. TaxID=2038653 RepID=UPI0029C60F61|nr:FadR/GntR family transcriptional regulator [Marispirochaeta sp.]